MEVRLRVQRFHPQVDAQPRWQEYQVDVPEHATVLDALLAVREEQDETLALRCSCRSHICGSCVMKVNGTSCLGCKTKIARARERLAANEPIRVGPAGNLPVVKDLAVDLEVFFGKVKAIEPYLQPDGPPPEREYVVPNEAMLTVREAMACILCGACVSECNSLEVEPRFLGPAALAKAWRFTEDPRDAADHHRLALVSAPGGIWDCTHCFACVEVCPKDVKPMERILELRRRAMDEGFTDNNGSRHSQAFADTIAESGWLDETRVLTRSLHGLSELLEWTPVGVRALLHGKVPLRHRRLPGAKHIRAIFAAAARRRAAGHPDDHAPGR